MFSAGNLKRNRNSGIHTTSYLLFTKEIIFAGNYHHSGHIGSGQMGVYSSANSSMANTFNQQRYN